MRAAPIALLFFGIPLLTLGFAFGLMEARASRSGRVLPRTFREAIERDPHPHSVLGHLLSKHAVPIAILGAALAVGGLALLVV